MAGMIPDDKIAEILDDPDLKAAAEEPSTQEQIKSGFEGAFAKVKDSLGDKWQDVRTIYTMAFDPEFTMEKKVKYVVIGALAYLISPIDLLPEKALGKLGLLDDVAVLLFALKYARPEIERYRVFVDERPAPAPEAAPETEPEAGPEMA